MQVLLTLDYELHGNGTGDPYDVMVEPTDRMLADFDEFGAVLTIMPDVPALLKFREYAESTGTDRFSYEKICEQLRRALGTGHDVQLHMHSSRFNARWEDERWVGDLAEDNIAVLELERISEMLRIGKEYLEELLTPVDAGYRCTAFRAPAWTMQPSKNMLIALADNGFEIDTSVFKYGKMNTNIQFDYSGAESEVVPWPASESNVCLRDPDGKILEIPIYCERRPIWTFLTRCRLQRVMMARRSAKVAKAAATTNSAQPGTTVQSQPRASLAQRAAKAVSMVTQLHPWKLDFNQCSGHQIVAALKRIRRTYSDLDVEIPVVLIGHSKLYTHENSKSLRPFLEFVSKEPEIRFAAFRDVDVEAFRR